MAAVFLNMFLEKFCESGVWIMTITRSLRGSWAGAWAFPSLGVERCWKVRAASLRWHVTRLPCRSLLSEWSRRWYQLHFTV